MLIHALPFSAECHGCRRDGSNFSFRRRERFAVASPGEDTALDLLERTLECDSIYEKRISPDCIAHGTEETTNAYFGFVLREIHNAKRGGDPDVTPAIDRYRVIDVPAKLRGGIRLKTNGSSINPRETSSGFRDLFRPQVAPAVAGAIMFSHR
jgi:hypothetical protein